MLEPVEQGIDEGFVLEELVHAGQTYRHFKRSFVAPLPVAALGSRRLEQQDSSSRGSGAC